MGNEHWIDGAKSTELIARTGSLVLIDAPVQTAVAEFNGLEGVIEQYDFLAGWIGIKIIGDGGVYRFRFDEFKVL